uniref:Uncharacterized protein n=1 Tax=Onchocerca volvulus TaxID=6282 RepID=A0A8R1XST5_ONCVO
MIIIYGMIINLFACIFVFSVSGAAVEFMFPMSVGKGLAMLWKHGENVFFIVLSLLFAKTSFGAITLILIYFSLFLSTISTQILTLEMIIMTVYRTLARIKFIEPKTSRNIIICIYFLLINLYIYTYGRSAFSDIKVRYFHLALLILFLAFLELLISIHIYPLKRLMISGISGELVLDRLLVYYYTNAFNILVLTLITLLPLSVIIINMIIHAIKAHQTGRTIKSLFGADLRWSPELGIYRQQALYEERATRAII